MTRKENTKPHNDQKAKVRKDSIFIAEVKPQVFDKDPKPRKEQSKSASPTFGSLCDLLFETPPSSHGGICNLLSDPAVESFVICDSSSKPSPPPGVICDLLLKPSAPPAGICDLSPDIASQCQEFVKKPNSTKRNEVDVFKENLVF